MKVWRIIMLAIIVILSVFLVSCGSIEDGSTIENTPVNPPVNPPIQEETTQTSENDIDTEFLKIEDNGENMVYSPLSIKYALKMLREGADGNTRTQIDKLIANLDLTKYKGIDEILSLANCVYVRDTYAKSVKNEFKEKLMNEYDAEINYDAFVDAKSINAWIENKTFGIISNMLGDEQVQNELVKMLLINALAIDMEWESQFDCSATRGEEFKLVDGNTMMTTMMHKNTSSDSTSYYIDKDVTALSMNLKKYGDTQLEFIAIMPEKNLSDYIENFSTEKLDDITKKFKLASKTSDGINISIPKFSFDYDLDLKADLIKVGITDAFDGSLADFTNMTNDPSGFYVSDALHKADIDFTEKGVKAAAVTVFVMKSTGVLVAKPEEIKIDKPFIYVIKDKNTNEVWFVGTVYEPNSWENDKAEYEYKY